MLSPRDGPIHSGKVFHRFADSYSVLEKGNAPLKAKLCKWQVRLQCEFSAGLENGVGNHRSFAMGSDSQRGFLRRWSSENIQTEIVAHDAGEQTGVHASPVFRMFVRIVGRRLERWPGWSPEWIDAGFLVQNLRDVTAFPQDGHTQIAVLNRHGLAATV